MIFISGVHGVGKSYFCNVIKESLGIDTYTASSLIADEKKQYFSSDKLSVDIEDNQYHLLNAVKRLESAGNKYILDGHFCLLNSKKEIVRIGIDTFLNLKPQAIVLLTEKPEIIAERRKIRDGVICVIGEIANFQNEEEIYAKEVAETLSAKLMITHGKDDLNSAINFIKSI